MIFVNFNYWQMTSLALCILLNREEIRGTYFVFRLQGL